MNEFDKKKIKNESIYITFRKSFLFGMIDIIFELSHCNCTMMQIYSSKPQHGDDICIIIHQFLDATHWICHSYEPSILGFLKWHSANPFLENVLWETKLLIYYHKIILFSFKL